MSAEPTAEQRAAAFAVMRPVFIREVDSYDDLDPANQSVVDRVARALAAAVIAEREKYLRVADELDAHGRVLETEANSDFAAGNRMGGTNLTGQHYATTDAARRIREVTT